MNSNAKVSACTGFAALATIVLLSGYALAQDAKPAETPAAAQPVEKAAPDADLKAPANEASSAAVDEADVDDGDVISDGDLEAQAKQTSEMARDLSPTLKPIYELGENDGKQVIKVDAWVNKKNLTYQVGNTLAVSVRPKQDAFVTILNVGSSGKVTVLYPNHFQPDAKVKADTTVRIPGRKEKWQITVGKPAGVDLIKVIASAKQLTLKELQNLASADEKNPVITLGRTADEAARDLSPQLKPEGDSASEDSKFGIRNILVKVRNK